MAYFFWAFVHILSIVGFQYTGVLWFLVPAVAHICIIMFAYIFTVAVAFDPNHEVKIIEPKKEYGPRFLVQLATAVTASQLYIIGYSFFAGMAMLQAVTLGLSVALQKLSDKE